jgi:hypothetical protein
MKPEMREKLAQLPFKEKIRKVGELIQLSRKVKTFSGGALRARLDKAAAALDAGEGVAMERIRENIRERATSPKKIKK